ncbi:O-antigen ligase family protein [Aminipila terrae]|uniref:O-antigen ligase family protein n=1 Tax=Aminipila terrae TaxID=2697030 RepID=A0A6P1M9J4_9FIRM|nr:O-antigen ligase family protein [Aminipila terrae]QHI71290.1 hypothetical protein Ami3637_01760 [Aminipila terrae]
MNLNKKIDINFAICFLLIATPFIDSINGIYIFMFNRELAISPGQYIRIIIILFFIFFSIKKQKGFQLILIFLTFFLFQQAYLALRYYLNNKEFFNEALLFSKLLFMVSIIILLISNYSKLNSDKIINSLINSAIIISIIIIVTKIFNIGVPTYTYAGHKGFFIEQNAISNILVSIIPFILNKTFVYKRRSKNLLYYILLLSACFLIGTRVAIFGSLIVTVICVFSLKVDKRYEKYKMMLVGVVLAMGIIFVNIFWQIYMDTIILRYKYFLERLDLLSFIFSSRNVTLKIAADKFFSDPMFIIMGTGLTKGELVELDLFDVLFFQGLFVFIIISSILSYPVLKFRKLKNKGYCLISYLIILILLIVSGHVIYTPMSATYLGAIYALNYKFIKEYRKNYNYYRKDDNSMSFFISENKQSD